MKWRRGCMAVADDVETVDDANHIELRTEGW